MENVNAASSMTFNYQLEEADHINYAKYMHWYSKDARRMRLVLYGLLGFSVILMIMSWQMHRFWYLLLGIMVLSFALVRIPGVYQGYWKKLHQRHAGKVVKEHLYGNRSMTFSADGITVSTEGASGNLQWDMISSVAHWNGYYAFHLQPFSAYWIPAQSIVEQGNEQTFRAFIKEKFEIIEI